ncbi:MAG: sulfatase-like hydrolase/transferase [Hyphomicrobiaceae bacterium]
MSMTTIARTVGVAMLALLPTSAVLGQEQKPNIVYMLVDNWGWRDISVQGGTTPTPRIDALAAEGMRLLNFNIENQCTPTRSALHTGRLPIRSGTQKVAAPGEPDGLAPWEYTIAELLSDGGYRTALFGKWHIGSKVGRLPNDQGYDEWWGINEGSNAAAYTSTPQFDPKVAEVPHLWEGKKGSPAQKVSLYDVSAKRNMDRHSTKRAIEFISRNAKRNAPFFLYIGFTQFHPPWVVHPDFANVSKAGLYSDIKHEVDHNVGQILDTIKAAGIANDTIVILSGDNGAGTLPQSGYATGEAGGSNGPWRGGLSTGFEGGLRTPAIVRWPGQINGGIVTDEIFSVLDWYPTLAALVGEADRVPTDRPIDGVDQSDFLLGERKTSAREHVVTYVGNRVFAVKWRNMKVHFLTAESTFSEIRSHTFPQVYDIKEDPAESFELWGNEGFSHAWVMTPVSKILAELQASMRRYRNIKPGENFRGYPISRAGVKGSSAADEDSKMILTRLTADGRVALYGIQFDLNEAEIKPDSEVIIRNIADVLKANPQLKIAVVGHTDSKGSHEVNMRLSKLRADAVVNMLRTKYKIASDRMFPAGAGFLAPLTNNDTEKGRALNRRVELIRMK